MKNNKMKLIILTLIIGALGIGTFIEVKAYQHEKVAKIEKAKKEKEKDEKEQQVAIQAKKAESLKSGINLDSQKYSYDAKEVWDRIQHNKFSNNGKKIVFLTFDDGTSKTVTPTVLDTLDKYNVKATFFVVGSIIKRGGEEAQKLLKEEFARGHAIGSHTYTHDYKVLYPGRVLNVENFKNELKKNEDYIKTILGEKFSFSVVRCPGGRMSWKHMEPLDDYLKQNNMAAIDWNSSSGDASYSKRTADDIAKSAIETAQGRDVVVVLMHDTYGKEETAKALPKIIEHFKDNGYEFKTLR